MHSFANYITKPWEKISTGAAIIVVAAFLVYLPSINGWFILDDDLLVTHNQIIKASDGLYRFWLTTEAADYWPVSNTSFWTEWRLWGMNPPGYHITNLILHVMESLLIWAILCKLCIPGAFLAAVFFVLHPVNVESVAWIAQLKEMLATLFFLLSILWYLKGAMPRQNLRGAMPTRSVGMSNGIRNSSSLGSMPTQSVGMAPATNNKHSTALIWYCSSFAAFTLAMLSKGSVAVLPILLLGITWWKRPVTKWDLVRLAPFFVVAFVLSIVQVWCQTHNWEETVREATFLQRMLGAGGVIWFYLYKAIVPTSLTFVYPQWHIQASNPLWWMPLFAVFAVSAILWRYRNNWSRPLLFAWGFFCVSLVPVMGFTDTGFMRESLVANHYQHIALIAVVAIVAAGLTVGHRRLHGAARFLPTSVAVGITSVLALITWQQNGLYGHPVALYQATLEKNPDSPMIHCCMGQIMDFAGQTQEALKHYNRVLKLDPNHSIVYNNIGSLYVRAGQIDEAIENYEHALRLKPDYAEAHNNLSVVLLQTGRVGEAIEHSRQSLQFNALLPEAHYNLGNALLKASNAQQAIEQFDLALKQRPDFAEAHYNLGDVYLQAGQLNKAIEHFQAAAQLKPDYWDAYKKLTALYDRANRPAEAISTAKEAMRQAKAMGQAALANEIEEWLKTYNADLSDRSKFPPSTGPKAPAQ